MFHLHLVLHTFYTHDNYNTMQLHEPHYVIARLPAQEVGYAASEQFHHYVLINE
jgi:hypothetical protein